MQDINSNELVVSGLRGFWILGRSFGDSYIIAICTDASRNSMRFVDPRLLLVACRRACKKGSSLHPHPTLNDEGMRIGAAYFNSDCEIKCS